MKKSMTYALLSMVALAVVLVTLIPIFYHWKSNVLVQLFGLFISGGLLVVDLLTIVSFIFIAFVLKIDNVPRAIKYALTSSMGIILAVCAIISLNPLRGSHEEITNDILKLTPIGTDMEEVIKVIESKDEWEISSISYESGYRRPGKPDPLDRALGRATIVGEKSIKVWIGEYKFMFIFDTTIIVYWGFDENGKLIGIDVDGEIDTF